MSKSDKIQQTETSRGAGSGRAAGDSGPEKTPEEERLSEATQKILREAFVGIRSEEDAEDVLERIENEYREREEEFEDEAPDRIPAEIADQLEVEREPAKSDPAEAISAAAEEIASAPPLERAPLDEGVGQAGREEGVLPREEQGRTMLRRVLLRRLKPLDAVDAMGFIAINSFPHPWLLDRFMSHLTRVMTGGHGWLLFLVPALAWKGGASWRAAAAILPALWLVTSIVEFPVKHFCRRKRPFVSIVRAVVVGRKPGSFSFPSGHSTAAVAGALLLCRYFPQYRSAFIAVATLTIFSRMYLGAHYPGDVLVGGIAGGLGAGVTNDALIRLSKGRLSPSQTTCR